MRRFIIAAGLSLTLVACATSNPVTKDIIALERAHTLAQQVAMVYTDLPRCGSIPARDKPVCSDAALALRMADADKRAFDAVQLAKKNSALISAAWDAIAAYQSLIPARR